MTPLEVLQPSSKPMDPPFTPSTIDLAPYAGVAHAPLTVLGVVTALWAHAERKHCTSPHAPGARSRGTNTSSAAIRMPEAALSHQHERHRSGIVGTLAAKRVGGIGGGLLQV